MDAEQASEVYADAVEAWERGDQEAFLDNASQYNEWLRDNYMEPLTPEEWAYDEGIDYDELYLWIDSLSHDEREAFFGY